MTYETVLVEKSDRIAVVTLNRPNKRNAMSPRLHEEMKDALETLRYDDEVGVVVITGAGSSFCAGMDLKEFFGLDANPSEFERITRIATEWRGKTLRYYPKATVAMINGYCFGGAFSIVEGCDLAIAAEDATFGLSEINFKHFPGGSVSKSLANLLRPRDALWYGMLGRPFDGKVAAEIGLVNIAVPAERLREETMQVAMELAQKDPHALRATKEGYRYSLEMSWEAAMSYSAAKEAELLIALKNEGRKEGIGGFLDKKYKPGLGSFDKTSNPG